MLTIGTSDLHAKADARAVGGEGFLFILTSFYIFILISIVAKF